MPSGIGESRRRRGRRVANFLGTCLSLRSQTQIYKKKQLKSVKKNCFLSRRSL